MFLLTATALGAAVNLGWPCSRLNWAWRNVWSTCSINSYVPTGSAPNGVDFPPAHWRSVPLDSTGAGTLSPTNFLDSDGLIVPDVSNGVIHADIPAMFCTSMWNTGGGHAYKHSMLRNRCRRALDAYGGIVKACSATPDLIGAPRGPITDSTFPDFEPAAVHAPHVTNMQTLRAHAEQCIVTDPSSKSMVVAKSPIDTCPGLLGWWTVVWHACGFNTYVPVIATGGTEPEARAKVEFVPNIAPLGNTLSPNVYLAEGQAVTPTSVPAGATDFAPQFIFCVPEGNAAAPSAWNARGPSFRTSRCRKALDQFGRTAYRCGGNNPISNANGAPQTGFNDVLRAMFLGNGGNEAPSSLYNLAPLCNGNPVA